MAPTETPVAPELWDATLEEWFGINFPQRDDRMTTIKPGDRS